MELEHIYTDLTVDQNLKNKLVVNSKVYIFSFF